MTLIDPSRQAPSDGGKHTADAPRRARWRNWLRFGRAVPDEELADTELPAPRVSTELAIPPESDAGADSGYQAGSALREWAERHTARVGVPHPGKAKATAKYWAKTTPKLVLVAIPKTIMGATRHVVPIARGAGVITETYLRWLAVPSLATAVLTAESPSRKSTLMERHHTARGRRTAISAIGAAGLVGGGLYLYAYHSLWLYLSAFIVVGVLDIIGRRGQAPKEFAPIKRQPLTEGMPLRQLTDSILAVFGEEGLEVTATGVIRWDYDRRQYRLEVSTYVEILPKHLRAIERGIGAPDLSIRMLNTDTATCKVIVIQCGDPLAVVPTAPYHATGSLTINDLLTIGVSPTDYPFALHLAGVHLIVVGKTGAGKTSVHLNNIIDSLSACRDVYMVGIDLTKGPLFSMWRGVIQKKAYTPEAADTLLDWVLAQIEHRAQVLDDIANDDDPTNDTSEWNTDLGQAIVVVIDEFPQVAKFNGTPKDTLNLLEKVETIHRTGRKHLVSLVIGLQKMGNSDAGSTVVSSQSGLVIVGPCDEPDTVKVFGTHGRDYGYAPHLLQPGTKTSINDAGKAYVSAPGFGPDVVRGYAPLANAEIKRRALQRTADGLPDLGAPEPAEDATVVPPGLAAVDAALKAYGNTDRLPSKLVVAHANSHGGKWTAATLAKALETEAITAGAPVPKARGARSDHSGGDSVNHYHRADIAAVLKAL